MVWTNEHIGDRVGLNSENGLNTEYQIYIFVFKTAANTKYIRFLKIGEIYIKRCYLVLIIGMVWIVYK